MRRNLRFWLRYTAECAEVVVIAVAVLLVISLVGADAAYRTTVLYTAPYYLAAAAALTIILGNYNTQALYVPLLLSMGETRRNLLLGFHFHRAVVIAVTVAASALCWLLVPEELSGPGLRSLPSVLMLLVLASALGSIVGTLYFRCKAVALIVIVLCYGAVGGVFGFAVAADGPELPLLAAGIFSVLEPLWGRLAIAAAAALAVDVVFHWALLRRQEVRL